MLKTVSRDDWQYVIPFLVCLICFFLTDLFGLLEKTSFAYWSGRLFFEPYRGITSHFLHGDINHLLANTLGIILSRYFLKALSLKSNYLFLVLVALLIPLQSMICWLVDIFLYVNPMSLSLGFSGILYGVYAFILLTTLYGKKKFVGINCCLSSNFKLFKTISLITSIGFVWSLLPGISFIGHLSGFIAGLILFVF